MCTHDTIEKAYTVRVYIALQSAKEAVAPMFSKMNFAAKQQYSKAMENDKVCLCCDSMLCYADSVRPSSPLTHSVSV